MTRSPFSGHQLTSSDVFLLNAPEDMVGSSGSLPFMKALSEELDSRSSSSICTARQASTPPPSSSEPQVQNAHLDDEDLEQLHLFEIVLKTIQHFFGGLDKLFDGVNDPREPRKIGYPLESLFAVGMLFARSRPHQGGYDGSLRTKASTRRRPEGTPSSTPTR